MRSLLKRFILSFLCLMLIASGFACGVTEKLFARQTPAPTPAPLPEHTPIQIVKDDHANVRFSDMIYSRPDTESLRASIAALEADIAGKADARALFDVYCDIYERFNEAESAMSLAYLLYAFDVTDPYYEQEYAALQSELNSIDLLMTDVSVLLFESSAEAEQLIRSAFGDEYLETVYAEESLNSEEIQQLQDQELALVNTYNRVSNDFAFTDDDGTTYTMDDLMAVVEDDAFYGLYDRYVDALNRTVGEIYVEMVDVRAAIAAKLGYGSYAAYMYDCYGRDYTLEDARVLQNAVKAYIVPVYMAAFGLGMEEAYAVGDQKDANALQEVLDSLKDAIAYYTGGSTDTETGSLQLFNTTYPLDAYLETLQDAAADFSPNLYAPLRYMLQNDLYDFSVNPKKMAGSFTTYVSAYDAPFIFSQWENDAMSARTVIHELGHFTNYYHNPSVGWSAGDSLDLAEVDSQGLELLMTRYYDRFFGNLAPYAERELLIDAMYALISGCMEDELQQAVYANPDMTLDEINSLYGRLSAAYGLDELYGYTGKEWAQIPHTFQSPMYYISYAVSMVPSMELWRLSQTDSERAKETYFRIVEREPYASFTQIVSENGLPDVFSEGTIRDIAGLLHERVS